MALELIVVIQVGVLALAVLVGVLMVQALLLFQRLLRQILEVEAVEVVLVQYRLLLLVAEQVAQVSSFLNTQSLFQL